MTSFNFNRLRSVDVESHLHRKVQNIEAKIMRLGGFIVGPKNFC